MRNSERRQETRDKIESLHKKLTFSGEFEQKSSKKEKFNGEIKEISIDFAVPENFYTPGKDILAQIGYGEMSWRKFFILEKKRLLALQGTWKIGAGVFPHWHKDIEETIFVIDGKLSVDLYNIRGEKVRSVVLTKKHASFIIAAGITHGVVALEDAHTVITYREVEEQEKHNED